MSKKRTFHIVWLLVSAVAVLMTAVSAITLSKGGVMEQFDPSSLTGASEAEAYARFGQPSEVGEFVLETNLREFRIELFNHFTPDEIAAENILIRELTWTTTDQQAMTLWLTFFGDKWKVVHGLIWRQDADF